MKNKKEKKWNSRTFRWFMSLMGERLPVYLLSILVSSLGISGVKVANSYLAKNVINAAQTRQMDGIYMTVFINFLVIIGAMLVWRVGIVRYNIEGKLGIAKVEKMVFSKAMRLPMSYYEEKHSGDFMSKLVFDTERAGDIYGSRLRRISSAIIASIVYLIPMMYFNWMLTLCLLGLSIATFLVNAAFLKPMKKMGIVLSKQNGSMTEKLTNILDGIDLTKIFPIGEKIYTDYENENKKVYITQSKTNLLTAGLECLNTMFDLLGALAFLGLGIIFVYNGWVDLGELTAIYTLYGAFRFSFSEIGRYLPQMVNCVANAQRIKDFLELEEESDYDGSQSIGSNKVDNENVDFDSDIMLSIRNVTFSYPDYNKNILDNYSLDVKKGTSVAITGASGKGKSTLAKLILGFYKPSSGDIVICGKSYKDMSLAEIRNTIGYVPQEPYLYNVSIADNIAYGLMGITDDKPSMETIIEAAKAANAHEFIMKLPKGYDTIPGERGNQLSGGEKQRIAIARAIIRNTPILLLDEATSALDNESERLVNDAINKISHDRTTIMIAHRESTIAMADIVVEL